MREQITNGWRGNLAAEIEVGATTLTLTQVSGLPDYGQIHCKISALEWVILPLNGTTTITGVTRGVDGSVAVGHSAGATVVQALTAGALANLFDQMKQNMVVNNGLVVTHHGEVVWHEGR
jgi:hypothetical protein